MNWVRLEMRIKKLVDTILWRINRIKIPSSSKPLENTKEPKLIQNTEQNEKMIHELEASKSRIIAAVRHRPP